MPKNGHSDYCIDKSDESKESPNIEERWQRHNQRKKQLSDTLCSLKRWLSIDQRI
jgi:hypothetical protein